MKKLIEQIEKHPIRTVGIIAAMVVAVGLIGAGIVHITFKIHCSAEWLQAEWKAGNALGYVGAILSAIAATLMSVATVYIAYKSYQQSRLFQQKEEDRECANTLYPVFIIERVECDGETIEPSEGKYLIKNLNASIYLRNIGIGPAFKVEYERGFGRKVKFSTWDDNHTIIQANEVTKLIQIEVRKRQIDYSKKIRYENILGYVYEQKLNYRVIHEPIPVSETEYRDEYAEGTYYLEIQNMGEQQRIGRKEK